MQDSVAVLTKKAIDASLKGSWKEAVELNQTILEKTPKDLDAKIRLGRALIQTKEFNKAKKIFKEVLEIDPINSVAQKNYKMAKEGRSERNGVMINPKDLIREPGTTVQISLHIEAKRISSESFAPAEVLTIQPKKDKLEIYKKDSHGDLIQVGSVIQPDIVAKANYVKEAEETLSATYVNGNEKSITVLIRSSIPVFRGERQEVRPYIKPGSLDEPELEIPAEYEE